MLYFHINYLWFSMSFLLFYIIISLNQNFLNFCFIKSRLSQKSCIFINVFLFLFCFLHDLVKIFFLWSENHLVQLEFINSSSFWDRGENGFEIEAISNAWIRIGQAISVLWTSTSCCSGDFGSSEDFWIWGAQDGFDGGAFCWQAKEITNHKTKSTVDWVWH